MKKVYKTPIVIGIALIMFFACTKEMDIQFSFPFEIIKEHKEAATINYKEPTKIQIVPERIVKDNVYRFKYTVADGDGVLSYKGGEPLPENTWDTCELLEMDLEFIGTALGKCKVEFTVEDLEGLTETILLNYEVVHNPFEMDANSTSTALVIGKNTPVIFRLENTGKDSSVTYESLIRFKKGSGSFYKTNDIGESTFEIKPNEYFSIAEGSQFYNLVLDETGENSILFETKDSNGQLKEEELSFNADIIDFTYIGAPQRHTLFVGESTNLNFEINELLDGGDVYESRYEINSGNATLKRTFENIEEIVSPGVNYPVGANAYYWELEALETGAVDITFFAKNASGTEKQLNITIEVSNGVFDFKATNSENFAAVNDDVLVNFLITETGSHGSPYTMIFESSSNGVLEIGGVTYAQGEPIPIERSNFIGNYKGLIHGKHDVLFTVTKAFNEVMEDDFSITFNEESFMFTAIAEDTNIYVNASTHINFNITDGSDQATYQVYYTVSGSGKSSLTSGNTQFNAGTFYDVLNGPFSWDFNALSEGNLTYTFYVTNNSGHIQHQEVEFVIVPNPINDFTFTAIGSANSETTGRQVPVNLNITETSGNSEYSMVFTTTGTGTLNYNGVNYSQGEPIAVTPGNLTASYLGSTSGVHDIAFTATNANAVPINRSDAISITYHNVDFNLSVSGDSSLYAGTSEDFNVHLSQVQNDPSITYSVAYSIASGSIGSGEISTIVNTSITMGQPYDMNIGTTAMNFTATRIGLTIIDVTVTDSNSQSHTSQVTFDVENIDFSFSGASQQNTIEVDETTNLNFTINEAVVSGAAYQMKYEIVSGNGNVKDGSTTQSVNTYYNVNTGSYSWEFEATTSSGPVELLFTALNTTTNVTHSQTVTITVNEPPVSDFTFRVIPSANTATVGESVLMHFNITETVGNSNYSMVFTTSSSATFIYNGIEYNQGQSIPVNSGNFTGTYKSSTAADHDILFTVTNANDVPISHSDDIAITYYLLEFEFSGASQKNIIKTGESTFLNFNISETFVSGNNYEMKYEIINGNGNVKDGGLIRSVNTYFNVNTGSYSWKFEGTENGTVELLFTALNTTTNVTRTQTIEIIVTNPPVSQFTFTAIPSANDGTVGQNIPINFNITETVGNSNYSMVFTSNGTGTLDYNGTSYNQGQPIAVSPGSFTGAYTGSSSGPYDITFTVTNTNDIPISNSDNISINYDSIDFTLSTVGDGSLFLNSQKDFYAILSQESNDNSITYRVRFSIASGSTGNGQIKTAGNNTTIPLGSYREGIVDVGSTSFLFEGTSQGVVNILVEVMDSDNRYKSSTVSFTIDNVPFTFDAAAQDGSIEIGESTNIFLNISEPTQSFTNYEVKYQITSSETAQISNNGTSINPNTYRLINTGSTPWTFISTEEGNIKVMFTVRNKNTLSIRTKTVEIEVNKIPSQFTFTAIPVNNSALINNCTNINFNLNQTVGNSTYSMVFTSSSSGTFTYNGSVYTQGQQITVTPGNFSGCYTGTLGGLEHEIEFTVTNSNTIPIQKEDDVTIEIDNLPLPNFNFSAIRTQSNALINNCVNVNFNLNEFNGNGAPYKIYFASTSSGVFRYNGINYNSGQQFTMNKGNTTGCYRGLSAGIHDIEFFVSNSNVSPISRSSNIEIRFEQEILDTDITFSYFKKNPQSLGYLTTNNGGFGSSTTAKNRFMKMEADFILTFSNDINVSSISQVKINGVNAVFIGSNKYSVVLDRTIGFFIREQISNVRGVTTTNRTIRWEDVAINWSSGFNSSVTFGSEDLTYGFSSFRRSGTNSNMIQIKIIDSGVEKTFNIEAPQEYGSVDYGAINYNNDFINFNFNP